MKKLTILKSKPAQSLRDLAISFWEELNKFDSSRLVVIIANLDKRTYKQNRFYWMIVNQIGKEAGEEEEDTHLALKCLFLERNGTESKIKDFVEYSDYMNFGVIPSKANKIPESKKLNKEDFAKYWKHCAKFGNAMYDLDLPLNPNEMSEGQYIEYLKTETT